MDASREGTARARALTACARSPEPLTWEVIGGFVGAGRSAIKHAVQRAYPSGSSDDENDPRAESARKALSHAKSVLRAAPLELVEQLIDQLPAERRVDERGRRASRLIRVNTE